MRLLVATRNAGKLGELRRMLDGAGIDGVELLGLDEVPGFPEAPETGRTFEDNALAKARDAARATGLVCVADDSGLAVDELNGMPGVLSARWSGGHGDDGANNALLLAQLRDTPAGRRGAAFVCTVALVAPGAAAGPGERVVRGEWRGRIAGAPRGAGGFGYDPVFIPAEEDARVAAGEDLDRLGAAPRSAAELAPGEKDALSHRGRALRLLLPELARLAGA